MLDFSQGPPCTIFDWLTIREQVRNQLRGQDIEILSTVYGLSHLESYEDPEICHKVDELVNQEANPMRSRYFLAVALASYFWEFYTMWGWEIVSEDQKPEHGYQIFSLKDGSKEYQQRIKKGKPGWVTKDLSGIQQKAFQWLIEGYQANPNDEEVMQEMFNMAARIEFGDCLFDRENLKIMQQVTNNDLSLKSNIYGQRIIKNVIKYYKEQEKDEGSVQ